MEREQSWQVITEQRLGLAQLLEGLSEAEWEQPSLCAGWRVRDVAAHVAMAPRPGWGRCSPTASGRAGAFTGSTTMLPYATPPARRVRSLLSCGRTRILAGCRW